MTRSHVHGTRRGCASTKTHYGSADQAEQALARILDHGSARLYSPSGFIRCERRCGGWVLTSKSGPGFASGKSSRRGRAKTRSR